MTTPERHKDFAKNYTAILKRYLCEENNEDNHQKLYRELRNYFSIIELTSITFTIEKTSKGLSVYFPDQDQREFIMNLLKPQQ